MRVLVTGACGFIGGHLVRHLASLRQEVAGLDRDRPVDQFPGIFFCADLLELPSLSLAFTQFRPEVVLHLAAETGLNPKEGLQSYAANIEGVANLIGAIRSVGTVQRAVFTSTQLVCRVGYRPTSDTDYAPDTLYGQSKVQTEKIVRQHEGGCPEWCLVRPTTVWGPGMNPHYQRFFRMIRRGWYFHVGARPLRKTYGYVGNVVHQYARLISADRSLIQGKVFYVADYEPISLRAWTDALASELGGPKIRQCPEWLMRVVARGGDLLNLVGMRSFPFNTFRLTNILTEYIFDVSNTHAVCGRLPWHWQDGVRETARWFASLNQEQEK
ncbi:MAG: NAD(P)-dependent oxidoreductase [Verrucomicrobiales bacterium]|nr:NAD(P)-dependent oxidoreductase [Verrucomicrobiales bacterium]